MRWHDAVVGMQSGLTEFFRDLLSDSTYTHANWGERHLTTPSWRVFEELVALLWQDMGYETELIQGSRDGGIDVIAENTSRIPFVAAPSIAIQAKQWSKKVREPKVRDLFGVQHGGHRHSSVERFDESILVTSSGCGTDQSGFTRGAKQFADQNGIGLVDGTTLVELLNKSNLSPLRLGRKPRQKWHLRESPCCGWSNRFSQNKTYDETVLKVFHADRGRIEPMESTADVAIDEVCEKCMNLRLD